MRKKKNVDEISLIAAFPVEEHALVAKDGRSGQFILQGDVKAKNAPYFAMSMMNFALKMMEDAAIGTKTDGQKFGKAAVSIVLQGLNERGIDPVKLMREMLEEMGYK